MKRIAIATLAATMMLAAPADAQAQGFLNKLKQKAEAAVSKAVGLEDKSAAKSTADEQAAESNSEQSKSKGAPTATDRIPKLRQTSFVWDGEVTPSKATSVQQLLNELPPLPTPQQIANPDIAEREAYYNRIAAVNLRVSELDEQWVCSEAEILAAREKAYKDMEGLLGLTVDEMKRLEDPNISEAEKTRLQEKMQKHILGGVDANGLEATMEQKQQKHASRVAEIEKEMAVYEKKLEAGTATEADINRMQALTDEMMAIQQDMMSPLTGISDAMNKAKSTKVGAESTRMQENLKRFSDKAAALRKTELSVLTSCEEIAKEYEKDLKSIYEQVYKETDVDKIHALYDRADDLMMNYRTRAAKVWLNSLSVRLENTKKLLPEAEKVYGDMAENDIIPSCIVRRAPLNVLTSCEDILDEAYADFPQPSVLPYHKESMNILQAGETVMFSECGISGGFDASSSLFDAFNHGCKFLIYNYKEDTYYKMENGKRTRLSGNGPFDFSKEVRNANYSYGKIPLRKGNREASFNKGCVLILHDGTYVYPVALQKFADRIEFIIIETIGEKSDFFKCTYKL